MVSFHKKLSECFDEGTAAGTVGGMVGVRRFVLGLAPKDEDINGVSSSSSDTSSMVTTDVLLEAKLGRNVLNATLSDVSERTLEPGRVTSIGGGMKLPLKGLFSVGEFPLGLDPNRSLSGSNRSLSQAEKTTIQWTIAITATKAMHPTRT